MYWWNYTREIILTVQGVENMMDEIDSGISPGLFALFSFVVTTVAMPVYAYAIITTPRREYIKLLSTDIVRKQYSLDKKD